ncbi:MAG: 1,4-alpha-glucan branching protein [Chitinophagaceae bacterium]|nr:1,4-alpha-glucan branching protein [Chitinophagaceae bacterium]
MPHSFSPVDWSFNTNMYEVNLRQYTPEGTFNAFAQHLPRLRDMGIDALWFMPITPISIEKRLGTLGSYYACSDYTNTNPEFGTVQDFKKLVQQAHLSGFKVMIDWVANHTGWDHVWTKTHPEFYKRNAEGDFYDSNNWQDVIDLNYYDHAMRREMIKAMMFWVTECDIDGFRCDMAHLVPLDFWRDARISLDVIKPLFWLAETEHFNYQTVFDCSYAWHWMHETERFAKDQIGVPDLMNNLRIYEQKTRPGASYLFFTTNHDENSWNGTEYEKYGPAARAFAVLSCTWNGIPLIYSGQEIPNMERLKFFDKDTIQWTEKNLLHDFYKILLHLRKRNPALRTADINVITTFIKTNADQFLLAWRRKLLEKEVLVFLNLSSHDKQVSLEDESIYGIYTDVFEGSAVDFASSRSVQMGPWQALVLEK